MKVKDVTEYVQGKISQCNEESELIQDKFSSLQKKEQKQAGTVLVGLQNMKTAYNDVLGFIKQKTPKKDES